MCWRVELLNFASMNTPSTFSKVKAQMRGWTVQWSQLKWKRNYALTLGTKQNVLLNEEFYFREWWSCMGNTLCTEQQRSFFDIVAELTYGYDVKMALKCSHQAARMWWQPQGLEEEWHSSTNGTLDLLKSWIMRFKSLLFVVESKSLLINSLC